MDSLKKPFKVVLRSQVLEDWNEFHFSNYLSALTVFNSFLDSDLDDGLFWSCSLWKGKKLLRCYSNYLNTKI